MKIINTLTRQKDDFKPINEGEVKIYACGPTVYNYIHSGNARPICVFDVLRRYFEWRGFKVNFVQNFTDIDDKLIKKANEEGITVPEVAERYIGEFWTDAKGLNVREATVHPRATENIEQIQDIIKSLIENGYAYLVKADDGQTVGTLAIVEAPDHFYDKLNGEWLINTENYVVIHRVAIHSRHAGKGYASKLFLSLIEYLETERPDIKSIRLSTNENNAAMQRIAIKSGFKKVGTLHGSAARS